MFNVGFAPLTYMNSLRLFSDPLSFLCTKYSMTIIVRKRVSHFFKMQVSALKVGSPVLYYLSDEIVKFFLYLGNFTVAVQYRRTSTSLDVAHHQKHDY